MGYYIIFNNQKNRDLGIRVANRPNIPIAKRRVTLITIPGRSESVIEDEETYDDIEISIEFNFINYKDFTLQCRKIRKWLNHIEDRKLRTSDDIDMYYKVLKVDFGDIEREVLVVGKFTVKFTLSPFCYFMNNKVITLTGSDNILAPEFAVDGVPIINIYGTGKIELLGPFTFSIEDISNNKYVTIDSVASKCYTDSYTDITNTTQGEFPILKPGRSYITWSGSVTKVEIIPNWRSY